MSLRTLGDKNKKMLARGLHGPRPTPLMVNKHSSTINKKQNMYQKCRSPVIVYLTSPQIIHVQPHEFKELVQRLTGDNNNKESESSAAAIPFDSAACSSSSLIESNDISSKRLLAARVQDHYNDIFYGDGTVASRCYADLAKTLAAATL